MYHSTIFKTTERSNGQLGLGTNFGNIKNFFTKQNMLSDSDINAIKAYNEEFTRLSDKVKASAVNVSNYTIAQKAANSTMQNASIAAQDMVAKANGSTVALGNLTRASKAAELGMKALAIAGNMIATWAIIKGIELAVKGIDKLAHSAEHCKERVDELMSNYQSAIDKANSNAKTIEDLASRYEELSKGVNNLGENVSLTADEYSEYNGIVNQIADMFPTLIQGYTNEGNAILSLKGNVEQLRDAYKEAQQEAYNMLIISGEDSDGNDIIKNWENLHGTDFFSKLFDLGAYDVGGKISTQDAIEQLKKLSNMSAETYRNIEKITSSGTREQISSLTDIEKDIGYGSFIYKALGIDGNVTDEAFANARKQAQALIQTYQAEIDSSLKNVQTLANAYLMTNDDYDKLDEQSKTAASLLVNSIDTEIANGFSSKVDVGTYVTQIVNSIKDNTEVQDALINLLSLDTSKMSIGDAKAEIDKYINIIAGYLDDENTVDLKLRLGVDIPQFKIDLRNRLSNGGQDLVVDDWINTLTEEEAKLANSTAFDEALERQKEKLNGAAISAENYSAALEDVLSHQNNVADETPVSPLSISETVDQLNSKLKPAMDSLNSAWNEIFSDDEFKLNSIDILSICDSIKSKLDDMKELGLDVDYSSYEDFIRVLNNSESEASDVDKAFDSLANTIAQAALTGAEDFRTMKAALEDLGVVNSDIIAFQSLINNTTALKEAMGQANLTMDEFVIHTEDGSIAATDAAKAFIEEMVGAENCQQALALLQLQQVLCNENSLNTTDDINACLTLAQAAGVAVSALSQLANVSAQYDRAVAFGDTVAQKNLAATMESIKSKINAEIANFQPIAVDFSGVGKNAKSAGSKTGKDYKDALKEQLSDLESVISGITSRINDQISVINEQKSAALESIDAQKEALEEAKKAAVEALEAERDAQLKILEDQKKALEKQIKAKQAEIDAINDAADARKREIDLQKAQYELERMQNQRTKLVYSEDKGMHYVQDTSGIRDAKEKVDDAKRQIEIANLEKEKKLLEDQVELLDERIDAINEYYDNLIEQTEKAYDAQIKALEKQRKETESYFESLIKNLENSKSKYEELTELLEKAELSAKLKQLGIDEEALLNGSEEEFEKLKQAYLDIVYQLNAGNDDVLSKLRELSGYDGTAPAMLSDSNDELDTMNGELDTANQSVGNVNSSLGETASTTSDVASNVGDITTNLSEVNGLVSEEQTAFNNLKQAVDEVIEAINLKTEAVKSEQEAVGIATSSEMADFLLLKEKILEVKETLESFGTQNEGLISNIALAIQSLNDISLDDGIIAQFTNLKEAIDAVTTAISGGGESAGSKGGNSGSGSAKGGQSGGKGSKGEGGSGNSLTGAIEQMGETANEVIGEPDDEGDGTVIGEFGSMETAVNDVTEAIGGGNSEGSKNSGGEDENNLIRSIVDLGETTEETLGESGGDGVIGRFEEFKDVIGEADEHVHGISDGLAAIDGQEVECTIKVNIETNGGSLPGIIGAGMNLGSAQYDAKYLGNAHVEGTALASGNWAVQSDEKKALVGEEGFEIIVRNGRFFTVGNNGAEMTNIQKGDIVFNHEQSVELLKHGHVSGRGKAYADGTVGGGKVLASNGRVYEPYDPDKDNSSFSKLYKAWNAYYGNIDKNVDEINKTLSQHLVIEHNQKMNDEVNRFVNSSSVVNNSKPNINVGDINITCPGVTSQEVVKQVGVELNHMFSGLHLEAMQQSTRR